MLGVGAIRISCPRRGPGSRLRSRSRRQRRRRRYWRSTLPAWSDNPSGTWYYAAVQEATIDHGHERGEDGVTELWTELTEAKDWTALLAEWTANNGASASLRCISSIVLSSSFCHGAVAPWKFVLFYHRGRRLSLLRQAIAQGGPNQPYLEDLLRQKPYQLQPETERVLAALRPAINAPYQIYNMAKLADMKFPSFQADGEEHPLGYSLYEDKYEYDPRTDVRREAYKAFYGKLREYENVTAAAYQANVQGEKIIADQRGHKSVFDYLLFWQKVDRSLYDRQIDLIMEKLAPHMRKYAKLLQKIHGLDKMTYADLKLPVDPGYVPPVTIEESQKYIVEGLSVMGEDYQEMIRAAYRERWVDFAQNQGKSTGGFCASPYGSHSFIPPRIFPGSPS